MTINNPRKAIYLPIAFAVVLAAGILLGNQLTSVTSSKTGNVFMVNPEKHDKVNDIINYVQQDYVDSMSHDELVDDAIAGILGKLDPHSQYIPAEDFGDFNDDLEGNFEGIGIQFRIERDTIMVIQIIPGGPSERVGLRAGDRIVMIDDSLMAGKGITSNQAVKKLKGPRGTQVKVGIKRHGVAEMLDYTITRDVIPTYSIDLAYMVDDEVGYIKLSKFAATTYEEFTQTMIMLQGKGMKRLILDLRGNYGGYLDDAIKISDDFLPDRELIVYTEGNSRPNKYAYATAKGMFENNPLVILIDESSASASEIVAGAVQDNDRGTIVGRRSFGKGLVQEQLTFPDGSALRLTVARYHTPTGRCIQRPYEDGTEAYYHDFYDRYMNGEMESADSIVFNDSLKYTTPEGKIVYGGGGIMPDVFIPIENDPDEAYLNRLLRKNTIFEYAFDYSDLHRSELSVYKEAEQFINDFRVSNAMMVELYARARKEGVTSTSSEMARSEKKIKTLLKAYIGRNLLSDAAFFPIYHEIDETFLAGMKEVRR
jgi:carboxyl-terminal processing protease